MIRSVNDDVADPAASRVRPRGRKKAVGNVHVVCNMPVSATLVAKHRTTSRSTIGRVIDVNQWA